MASAASSATRSLASWPLVDRKAAVPRQSAPHSIGLPSLPPPPHVASPSSPLSREAWKTAAYGRRVAGNFISRATGIGTETTTEITTDVSVGGLEKTDELPDIVKKLQDAWEKLEDKYTVSALALAAVIALWSTGGMLSAIDRLPLVPGVLELVGIGFTGWFSYKNLVFKPEREAVIAKVKSLYADIIGSS